MRKYFLDDTNRVVLAAENEESCYINASFVDVNINFFLSFVV